MLSGEGPIYQQLADRIASDILAGTYPPGSAIPSTNEYAAFYTISPITAAKGINLLVDEQVLYKKRGIGMFVADGARALLLAKRRTAFEAEYVHPLLAEAELLGIDGAALAEMIHRERNDDQRD